MSKRNGAKARRRAWAVAVCVAVAAGAIALSPAVLLVPDAPAWSPAWLTAWAFHLRLTVAAPVKEFRSIARAVGPDLHIERSGAVSDLRVPVGDITLAATLYRAQSSTRRAGVLLLHANAPDGRRLALYQVLAPRLAACGYTVLIPDLRGYGESGDPPDPSAVASFDYRGDALRALSALDTIVGGGHDLHVIGHSLGGGIAIAAALEDPRVRSVVAIGPTRRFRERMRTQLAYSRARMMHNMDLPVTIADTPYFALRDAINIQGLMPRLVRDGHPPLLLLEGELEPAHDLGPLTVLADSMAPPVELRRLAGADHFWNSGSVLGYLIYDRRAVDELSATILEWFARYETATTAAGSRPPCT